MDYLETWQGMLEAQQLGLARSIGVSNFNQEQIERVITNSSVVPQVLQVEVSLEMIREISLRNMYRAKRKGYAKTKRAHSTLHYELLLLHTFFVCNVYQRHLVLFS